MKKLIAGILCAGVLASASQAKVSFSLDIELLTDGGGSAISNSGLLVLVVDAAGDGIAYPSDGSFGEEVVASWDLSLVGPGESYITLITEDGVDYGANWDAGEKLALLWFPGLADGELPGATEVYGIFSDELALSGGDPWLMPSEDVFMHNLAFFTQDADSLLVTVSGSLPTDSGKALFSVDSPPPAGLMMPAPVMAANSGDGAAVLTWDAPTVAPSGGYVIRRSSDGGTTWVIVGFAGASDTSYSDPTIKGGLEYEYEVIAQSGEQLLAGSSPALDAERSYLAAVAARAFLDTRDVNGTPTPIASRAMYAAWDISRSKDLGDVTDPTKEIIVQGTGPFYEKFGIDPRVLDLKLDIFRHTDPLDFFGVNVDYASSDEWMAELNAVDIAQVQMDLEVSRQLNNFDVNSLDTAYLGAFLPGYSYSAIIASDDGSKGTAHIGVYSAEYDGGTPQSTNRITALSTRGYLGSGAADKMFGYFKIEGNVAKDLVIRVEGPGLTRVGLGGTGDNAVLEDPRIVLNYHPDESDFFGNVVQIAENDDWEDQTSSDLNPAGYEDILVPYSSASDLATVQTRLTQERDQYVQAFDSGAKDSLLYVTLKPGHYTFAVTGETGIAVLKVFEME